MYNSRARKNEGKSHNMWDRASEDTRRKIRRLETAITVFGERKARGDVAYERNPVTQQDSSTHN